MNGKLSETFYVIKEFSIVSNVVIPITLNEPLEVPAVAVKVKINDLVAHFTPFIYKKFVNIGKVFALDATLAQMLKTDKKVIVDTSVKRDSIFCYSAVESIWKSYYVILSGNYLYFYENEAELFPLTYYYIENARVRKLPLNGSTGIYEITVDNRSEAIRLGMEEEAQCEDWNAALLKHIESISVPDSETPGKIPKPTVLPSISIE